MLVAQGRLAGTPLAYAVAAGVLSSVIPYATDLMVLRSVPPRLFGVLISAQPGLAALAGLVVLDQVLALHEWIGLAIVATANALAVGFSRPVRRVAAPAPVLEPAA
jgi:inner membrane transporter RhtA